MRSGRTFQIMSMETMQNVIVSKIVMKTEEDTGDDINKLKEFLRQKKHPIVEKFWRNGEPQPIEVPPPNADWPEDV